MKWRILLFLLFIFYIFCTNKNDNYFNIVVSFPDNSLLSFKSIQKNSAVDSLSDPLQKLEDLNDQPGYQNIKKIITAESCGKNKFPYGMYIEPITDKPMMYCIDHQCSNQGNVKCYTIANVKGCSRNDEWIAGFITKNNTVKIECCRYNDIRFTAFIKTIYFSTSQIYVNDQLGGKKDMIKTDFINSVRKIETKAGEEALYSVSIYRMKCFANEDKKVNVVEYSTTKNTISAKYGENNSTMKAETQKQTSSATTITFAIATTSLTSPSTVQSTISPSYPTSVIPLTTTLSPIAIAYSDNIQLPLTTTVVADEANKNAPILLRLEKSPNLKFKSM